jgi:heat shock protein HslJ
MLTPENDSEASLTIDGTLVSGSMGVNRFSGQIGAEFSIGPVATTRMAGPPELMLQEDTILEHVQEADTIEVIEDGMNLRRDRLLLVELERKRTAPTDRS